MKSGHSSPDWGHLLLILVVAGITVGYAWDAWDASSSTRNMVLILPASIAILILCIIVAAGTLRNGQKAEPSAEQDIAEEDVAPPRHWIKPALLMVLFAAYICSIPWLGFDVGSAIFIFLALTLDGDRHWPRMLLVAVGFAFAATLVFAFLLPYPLPTVVL